MGFFFGTFFPVLFSLLFGYVLISVLSDNRGESTLLAAAPSSSLFPFLFSVVFRSFSVLFCYVLISVLVDNLAESTLLGGGKIKKKKIEARGQAESTLLAGGKIRGGGNRSSRTERSRICSCVHHETNLDPQIYL